VKTAQQRAAADFACPDATAKVRRKETIEVPATTGWSEPPHRAVFAVDVTGCGERGAYVVACDRLQKADKTCVAGGLKSAPR